MEQTLHRHYMELKIYFKKTVEKKKGTLTDTNVGVIHWVFSSIS